MQVSTGLIVGNYIHDPGYIRGDHTNGIYAAGSTDPLTIYGNTVFNNLGQTDAINLAASTSRQDVANKMVVDNLLAGGGYSIRRRRPCWPHVEHRHQGQRVRPALLPGRRPVRPGRLLQPAAGRERLVGERLVGDHPVRQGPARASPAGYRAARCPPVRSAAGQCPAAAAG